MAVITIFSNRVYKDKLNPVVSDNLIDIMYVHNKAKIKAYSILAYDKPLSQSIHLTIKDMFSLNTYYANYAVTEAKWVVSSNQELRKIYIEDTKNNISHRKDKIKSIENKLKFWSNIHKHIIEISKAKKEYKTIKLKAYRPFYFFTKDNAVHVEANFKKETIIYNVYDFEHTIVVKKLKSLKNKFHFLQRGLKYQEDKLINLKQKPIRTCFGSKKLFKEQFTNYNDQSKWMEDFHNARHKNIQLQGVNTVTQGNACVKYNYDKNILSLQLPYENKTKKYHQSEWFTIENVEFPYKKEELINALKKNGLPVSWRIENKGDYYIFKVSFEVAKDKSTFNYSKVDGVIGYDINYNHIAWSETDTIGNLIDFGVVKFNIDKKTSGQVSKILELCALTLVNIAKSKNKPLVGEDIKNINKSKLTYGNKKRNYKISRFAHTKIIEAIASRAFKDNIEVYYVNPAYTSQVGKIKYMKAKGISIHVSASYCIARRTLGYKEKIPKQYRKYTKAWSQLFSSLKHIKIHYLYNLPHQLKCLDLKQFVQGILDKNTIKSIKPIVQFNAN